MPAKPSIPRRLMHPATGKSDVQAHWPHGVQILPQNRTTVGRVRHTAPVPAPAVAVPDPRRKSSSPDPITRIVGFATPQPGSSGMSRTREPSASPPPMTQYQHQPASRVRHAPSVAAALASKGETSSPDPVVHLVDFENPQPGVAGVFTPPRLISLPQIWHGTGKTATCMLSKPSAD